MKKDQEELEFFLKKRMFRSRLNCPDGGEEEKGYEPSNPKEGYPDVPNTRSSPSIYKH